MQSGHKYHMRNELALLGLLALLWGASYPLIKVAVATVTPITLVAVRVGVAAAILWVIVLMRGCAVPRSPRLWGTLFVQSCLNSVVPWTMIAWGQQFVDSGLAGILNSTSPIFVFFITLIWTRHEATNLGRLAGAIIGLAGVVFIIGADALHGLGQHVVGQIAIVLATVSYACAAIYGRRFAGIAPEVTAAAAMTWATAVLVPAGMLLESPLALAPSAESLIALGILAVFSTAGAFVIYFRLVTTLGSLGVASVGYLRAGVAVLIGSAILGEPLTWRLAVGLTAVVVGVAAINGQLRFLGHFWHRGRTATKRRDAAS